MLHAAPETFYYERDKPVMNAAKAVQDTAEHALLMLKELQAGWLWRLLTIEPKPKRQV